MTDSRSSGRHIFRGKNGFVTSSQGALNSERLLAKIIDSPGRRKDLLRLAMHSHTSSIPPSTPPAMIKKSPIMVSAKGGSAASTWGGGQKGK
jgi:hypothetical protein